VLHRFRPRLSYANVMVTIIAFIVLGGGAYAAFHLPKNSVRSKNIVNGEVKKPDLKAPEGFHRVDASGEPQFESGASNASVTLNVPEAPPAAFYKDNEGVVHLQGLVITAPNGRIFDLPRGYRPKTGKDNTFTVLCAGAPCGGKSAYLTIQGAGVAAGHPGGLLVAPTGTSEVSLDGVTFRAQG
jgi:hypothetical protein